jgi:NADPH2:quinone reductase
VGPSDEAERHPAGLGAARDILGQELLMRAGVVAEAGGIKICELPEPTIRADQVLIRVRACGLARADLVVASGQKHGYRGGVGAVSGSEWSGEVAEVGANVSGWKVGDRAMGSAPGAWAEYVAADPGRMLPFPAATDSFEKAAALPASLHTTHDALITNGKLQAGQSVLIQGASSTVGLMALQVAKAKGAVLVIGTSTNPERRARLKDYGADLALDSRDPNWPDEVNERTSGGVDLIMDMVAGPAANQNLQAVKVLGRIVNIGRLGGNTGEFDFDLHGRKRIRYIGASFRTRSPEEIREIYRKMWADIGELVSAGKLSIPLDRTFRLDEVNLAIDRSRKSQQFGKIVIVI